MTHSQLRSALHACANKVGSQSKSVHKQPAAQPTHDGAWTGLNPPRDVLSDPLGVLSRVFFETSSKREMQKIRTLGVADNGPQRQFYKYYIY